MLCLASEEAVETEELLAAGGGVGVGEHVMTYWAYQVLVFWGMQELTMVVFTVVRGHVEVTGPV